MRKDVCGGGRGAMRGGPLRSAGCSLEDFRDPALVEAGAALGQFSTDPKKALDSLSRDPEMSSAWSMVEIGGFGLALTVVLSGESPASLAVRLPLLTPRRCVSMVHLVLQGVHGTSNASSAARCQAAESGPLCFYPSGFGEHCYYCHSLSTQPTQGSPSWLPVESCAQRFRTPRT